MYVRATHPAAAAAGPAATGFQLEVKRPVGSQGVDAVRVRVEVGRADDVADHVHSPDLSRREDRVPRRRTVLTPKGTGRGLFGGKNPTARFTSTGKSVVVQNRADADGVKKQGVAAGPV